MTNGLCTRKCKDKMKIIYEESLECYYRATKNFFDDAKVFKKGQGKDLPFIKLPEYLDFFSSEYPERDIMMVMKVGLVDGKPVRLCDVPEGVKSDIETTGLTDSEDEEQGEEESDDDDDDEELREEEGNDDEELGEEEGNDDEELGEEEGDDDEELGEEEGNDDEE